MASTLSFKYVYMFIPACDDVTVTVAGSKLGIVSS